MIYRLVSLAWATLPVVAQSEPIAFVDVTVIPMAAERQLPGRTVIVRDGRIVALGAAGDVEPPAGAKRIEGTGKYLLPGLADLHVHLERLTSEQDLMLFVRAGVTTVRAMDGRPEHLKWRERIANGKLRGPTIWTAGPIIDGDPAFWDDTVSVKDPDAARRAVRDQAKAGYDFIKVYHQLDRPCYAAILDQARELALRVAGHVPLGVGLERVFTSGQDCVEHLRGYPRLCEADDSPLRRGWHWSKLYFAMPIDAAKVTALAHRTADAGVWNCPTLIVNEKHEAMRDIEELLDDERLGAVPDEIVRQWDPAHWDADRRAMLERRDDDDYATIARGNANARAVVRALHDAGAGILAGTDTPNPFVIPGAAIHEELELLVEAGLSPYAALRAATIDAARYLNRDDLGRVAVGARADLVLLDADPLADITNTARIAGVLCNGRWLER